jgi:hypothetical protein
LIPTDGTTIEYGDPVYWIVDEDSEYCGMFTNDEDEGIAINAMFIGEIDSDNIAPIVLYNSPRV